MDRSTMARTGIAGAVAGLGLAVGGVALASAETEAPSTSSSAAVSTSTGAPDGRPDRGHRAEALAEELGLDEATVQEALDAVREDLRASAPEPDGTPRTDAERAARQAALAKALAAELDVAESKVTAALAVLEKEAAADRAERRTEARADLVTRLDTAVKAGTLTAADKASVLKAFDAEILGGGGRGPGGHGPGAPGDVS